MGINPKGPWQLAGPEATRHSGYISPRHSTQATQAVACFLLQTSESIISY
jgi:hypothetical protein